MSLPTQQMRSVVFLGHQAVGDQARLTGTGFLVGMPAGPGAAPRAVHLCIVTCDHVVPHEGRTFMRLRRVMVEPDQWIEGQLDEEVVDVDVLLWHRHPTRDLALAVLADPDPAWAVGVVEPHEFASAPLSPLLGQDVFFAGLLANVETMGERQIPMLRSGMIGALDQVKVPVRDPAGILRRLDGHLIDCRSFGGFSGAPCFVKLLREGEPTPQMGLRTTETHWLLLGVLGGHFDHSSSVRLSGGDKLQVPTSAGVAVVYPCAGISELLADEDVGRDLADLGSG